MRRTIEGTISRFSYEGLPYMFFVANKGDDIQARHFEGRLYEPEELAIIASHVSPGASIVDIGSNVGNHAIYFDKALKARRVYVVEPNPTAIELLDINLRLNEVTSVDRRFIGRGFGAKAGRAEVRELYPNNLGAAELEQIPNGSVQIESASVALAGLQVDFVKADVEGMEIDVLQGLIPLLLEQRPKLFIEVRDVNRPAFDRMMAGLPYQLAATYRRYEALENLMFAPKP